jgi:hypothetical protein
MDSCPGPPQPSPLWVSHDMAIVRGTHRCGSARALGSARYGPRRTTKRAAASALTLSPWARASCSRA